MEGGLDLFAMASALIDESESGVTRHPTEENDWYVISVANGRLFSTLITK